MYSPIVTLFLLVATSAAAPSKRCNDPTWPTSFPSTNVFSSHFTGFTVFGDSFSDDGQAPGSAWEFTGHSIPNDPTYSDDGGKTRRFSNGPVWVENLSKGLDIPLVDYAVGGATAGPMVPGVLTNLTGYTFHPPTADQQLAAYVSSLVPGQDISKELFVVFIGANDGFNIVYAGLPYNLTKPTDLAGYVAQQVSSIVTTLISKGAAQFVLPTYPDLSTIPLIAQSAVAFPSAGGELKAYSDALRSNILALAAAIPAQSSSATVNVTITAPDFHDLNEWTMQHGDVLGFKELAAPCVGPGTYPNRTLCSTDPDVQNTYLHWDDAHPTAKGHQFISLFAFGSLLTTYGVPWSSSFSSCI